MSEICKIMHTHRGSWRPLWAWDRCCWSSFYVHNLRQGQNTVIHHIHDVYQIRLHQFKAATINQLISLSKENYQQLI